VNHKAPCARYDFSGTYRVEDNSSGDGSDEADAKDEPAADEDEDDDDVVTLRAAR